MNIKQKIVLIAAIAVVTLLLLFPPWYSSVRGRHGTIKFRAGYRYINSPRTGAYHIDTVRWLLPIGAVGVMAVLAYLELGAGRRK